MARLRTDLDPGDGSVDADEPVVVHVSKAGRGGARPAAFSSLRLQILACRRCSLGAADAPRMSPRNGRAAAARPLLVFDSRTDHLETRKRIQAARFCAIRTVLCATEVLATRTQIGACRDHVLRWVELEQPPGLVFIGERAWREFAGEGIAPADTWNGIPVEVVDRPRTRDDALKLRRYLIERYATPKSGRDDQAAAP